MKKIVLSSMLALLMCVNAASADETLMDELKQRFQSKPLTLGALIQVVGIFEDDDTAIVNNGFGIANFRLSLRGQLDGGWGYFLQTSFVKEPAFLDANVRYRRWQRAGFDFGAFKTPFSAEFLTGAASIDFVNRSQVVTLLAPGRQVGAMAHGKFESGFGYRLAALNGNGLNTTNDDDRLMGAGRLDFSGTFDGGTVAAGINAYHSYDTNAPIGVPITGDFLAEGFAGQRMAYGADVRVESRSWLAAAEFIGSQFDPRGGTRVKPSGYHLTCGYKPTTKTQVLLRWDSFSGDGAVADADLVVIGFNYWPTSPTEFQLNAAIPTKGDGGLQLLANVQVGF